MLQLIQWCADDINTLGEKVNTIKKTHKRCLRLVERLV
jgi:hypothetical protein